MDTLFTLHSEAVDGVEFIVIRPKKELSNAEYDSIKPYMERLGAHWRERIKGFVINKVEKIHDEDEEWVKWKEENQFFGTPKKVANRVVELAEIHNGCVVLEPSAGDGKLLDAIPSNIDVKEYAVEPTNRNFEILQEKGYHAVRVTFEDFYEEIAHKNELSIDRIIMNPPFSGQRDIIHTMMAYNLLHRGGIIVSVVSENSLYYKTDKTEMFNKFLKETGAIIEHVEYGAFKESGTTVDTVIIKINKN